MSDKATVDPVMKPLPEAFDASAGDAPQVGPPGAAGPDDQGPEPGDAGNLSQWQLIRRGFAQHRLALVSLHILLVFYLVALFAEFFAVAPANLSRVDAAYAPPQLLQWSISDGLHAPLLVQRVDPVTLRRNYVLAEDRALPLTLFAETEPYHLMGFIPMSTRLLGVDTQRLGDRAGIAAWYPLGADRFGRCIYSRIVMGARVSLSIGLVGVVGTFMLGMTIGGISGYMGGWVDTTIQRIIEIVNSLPQLPLWIALAAVFPAEWSPLTVYFAITVALSLLNWTGLARVVRGKILSLREEDYAIAARLLGASHGRVLFRHLIPGFVSHILVALTLSVPMMILGETTLSFLGLGLRPPVVSWGVMLQDCLDVKAVRFYPWLLLPVVFIMITVLSFNFVGDGMRDAADPYSSR